MIEWEEGKCRNVENVGKKGKEVDEVEKVESNMEATEGQTVGDYWLESNL